MIPVLFNKNEQQFRTYGLGEISDIINPKVTRERNGQYILYFQYPQNGKFSDVFEEDMKIKSDAGVRTKWQTFEISRVIRKEGQLIEVFAKHISQSLLKDALNPNVNVPSSNAQQALNIWNSNRIGDEDFDVWSDITTTNSTSWNIREVSNAFEALAGVQGSVLDVWGGEYEFDNKTIRLHKEMGRKSPVPLEYGRNITGLEQDQQEDNIYTSIYPFAVYIPEEAEEPETVTLPEHYVDGKYLDMHPKRKIRVIDFSGEFKNDDVPTVDRLRTLANRYVETNEIGLPHENLKVSYIDLSKTLDYKEFQTMEEVELNDRLPIFYPNFGITNENAKVVIVNYDPIKEENTSIELGVIGQSFRTVTTGGIGPRLDKIEKQQETTNNYIVNNKGNRIWYETPDENMEHKIGDTWFEKNGPYDRIRVWNGSQWETIIDSEDINKNADAIAEQQQEIEDARQVADEAADEINTAIQNAGFTSLDDTLQTLTSTVDGTIQRVGNAEGKITQIETNVSGLQTTVLDPVNGLATQVSTLANGFNVLSKEIENVDNLLEDSEIGSGRNTSYHQKKYSISEPIEDGEDVTLSIKAYTGSQHQDILIFSEHTGSSLAIIHPNASVETNIYHISFKWTNDNADRDNPYLNIYIGPPENTNGREVYWAVLQRGSRGVNDWTANDMNTQSQLSVLSDNINLRVEKGELLSQINIEADRTLIQSNRLLLNANNTVITGTAWMDGAIIANASIDGAKIQDATIGSAKIANLDVDKLSGSTTNFVRSAWNAINSNLSIDGTSLKITTSNTWDMHLGNAGVTFTGKTGELTGSLRASRGTDGQPEGTLIIAERGYLAGLGRRLPDGLLRSSLHVDGETGNITVSRDLGANSEISATTFSGPVYHIGDYNRLVRYVGNEHTTVAFEHRPTVTRDYDYTNDRIWLVRTSTVMTMYANINMNGMTITNQSDIRMKKNITNSGVNALKEIERLNFVNFEWDETKGQDLKPKGVQFGIIAQHSPFLQMKTDDEESYLSVDMNKQVNLNSKASQELLAYTRSLEKRIEVLENE